MNVNKSSLLKRSKLEKEQNNLQELNYLTTLYNLYSYLQLLKHIMQVTQSQVQKNQQETQPPGIFYPVLSEAITYSNTEAFIKCSRKNKNQQVVLEIFDDHIFARQASNISVLNLQDECFFGYKLQSKNIWFQHKQTKGRVQFVAENDSDLQSFVQILRSRCPQQNFKERYSLIQKKGEGKKSEVFTAKRKEDGEIFAVKIQKDNSKMKQEIEILRQLHHPNLIFFRQYFIESDNTIYIVMDYEDGGNLLKKIKPHEVLTYKEKLKVVIDMINALQFLRIKGIVHRDIKPENILYSRKDGCYKLADFGLAMRAGEKISKISGTPGYMAPQLLQEDSQVQADFKSDIYSMGLVFYELFTTKQYYSGDSQQQILQNNIKAQSFRKKSYSSIDSHGIQKKLLQRMIRTKPDDRKNSYEIMISSTFNKINRQYEQENRSQKSSNQSKTRSSESEEEKFVETVKRILKIKSKGN